MAAMADALIHFDNVSKFYGDVLGVNKVTLSIEPGVTSLVGPNGSGKTTLMNLMSGLIFPTRGSIKVRGLRTDEPERLFRELGYCAQFDSFPKGVTGRTFVRHTLELHGLTRRDADHRAGEALERVGMGEAADRKCAGYSKGMRQRVRLAQAIAHRPGVLILDEPLNGLDPMARAESLALFKELGREGLHVLLSSHILHEVDRISDRVILISHGYIVAEGQVQGMREEVTEHPLQILVRCSQPARLASRLFAEEAAVEVRVLEPARDGRAGALLVATRDVDRFYLLLNEVAVEGLVEIESVAPADDDALSVYHYLIGGGAS